jgi:hypothetical protein
MVTIYVTLVPEKILEQTWWLGKLYAASFSYPKHSIEIFQKHPMFEGALHSDRAH